MRGLVHDPVVFQTHVWRVERALAEQALARQPGLLLPAKLVEGLDGATGIVAEVPRLADAPPKTSEHRNSRNVASAMTRDFVRGVAR